MALIEKEVDRSVIGGLNLELEGFPKSKPSVFSSDGSLTIHAGDETFFFLCSPFFLLYLKV